MQVDRLKYWNQDHSDRMGLIDKVNSQYSIAVEQEFPRNASVADLGGGTGGDTMFFLKQGHKVVVFDISQIALDFAKDRAKREGLQEKLDTQQVDLQANPIPARDNQFEIVYARLSLHYFDSTRTSEIFREIHRILKPGGSALLTFKSPTDQHEMAALKERATEIEPNVFDDNGIIKSRYTLNQLKELLKNAGILNFDVTEKTEKLIGKGQNTRTGTSEFVINEVVIKK